jgi:hypothetical protein
MSKKHKHSASKASAALEAPNAASEAGDDSDDPEDDDTPRRIGNEEYTRRLRELQNELVKLSGTSSATGSASSSFSRAATPPARTARSSASPST